MKTVCYLMLFLSVFCFSCTEELSLTSEKGPEIKLIPNGLATKSFINEDSIDNTPMVDAFEVCNQSMIPLIDDNIVPFSITGCQTFKQVVFAPQYLGVSKEVAASLGIDPTRTYKSFRYEGKLRAGINNGLTFVQLSAPLCGYYPAYLSPLQRGYTAAPVPNTNSIIMTTWIYKCISDSQGQSYDDLWIPCKPENVVWDFGVK